jgi:hypothetical protein
MSQAVQEKFGLRLRQFRRQPRITQADNSRIQWAGWVEGSLFLAGMIYPHQWLVPAPGQMVGTAHDLLIGTDLMEKILRKK